MSGVNLIDTLRNVPRTNSANSAGQGRSSQPPQFQSNYTMKGKGKGRGAHIIPMSAVTRPKRKVHSFGTDSHSVDPPHPSKSLLRASSRIFAEDATVMKDQASWLDQQGYIRRVENYTSYTNDDIEAEIRRVLSSLAPPGTFDLVKLRPSSMYLSQDSTPITELPNAAVSFTAHFKSGKHAFIFIHHWRNPSAEQEDFEYHLMKGWYQATKDTDTDDDTMPAWYTGGSSSAKLPFVSVSTPPVTEQMKYKLGRNILAAILASDGNYYYYHHVLSAKVSIPPSVKAKAIPAPVASTQQGQDGNDTHETKPDISKLEVARRVRGRGSAQTILKCSKCSR
ncbi:hypothetical protein QFC24_005394 [Naganishia onofrii]|uniref:Uncharacterized protein n=1 Tax=Naganishia onofrii TaxID=1851511 RepID=A0ACC2X8Z7_9TREE|nr:hypothetical protein QFC24_005394 [Naganishia onofrii]